MMEIVTKQLSQWEFIESGDFKEVQVCGGVIKACKMLKLHSLRSVKDLKKKKRP